MPKPGDVRGDGFVFRCFGRRSPKTGERYECWLSPDGWAKYRERKQRIERERRAAVYADPVRLAKYREGMARRAREQRLADPVPAMLRAAKGQAKARSVPFDLTPADVVVPKRCQVLGIPLAVQVGLCTDNSPELDRIVGSRGYVRETSSWSPGERIASRTTPASQSW